jgi:hypothetical protein
MQLNGAMVSFHPERRASSSAVAGGTPQLDIAFRPLLDAAAAGDLLGVPASWVLAQARTNRIPHLRLGRYVRFDANELAVWCRSHARGPWRSPVDPPICTCAYPVG